MFNEKFNKTLNCILKYFGNEIGEYIEKMKSLQSEQCKDLCRQCEKFEIEYEGVYSDLMPFHGELEAPLCVPVIDEDEDEEIKTEMQETNVPFIMREKQPIEYDSMEFSIEDYRNEQTDKGYDIYLVAIEEDFVKDAVKFFNNSKVIPFKNRQKYSFMPFVASKQDAAGVEYIGEKIAYLMLDDYLAETCITYNFNAYYSYDGFHICMNRYIENSFWDHMEWDSCKDVIIDIEDLVEFSNKTTIAK